MALLAGCLALACAACDGTPEGDGGPRDGSTADADRERPDGGGPDGGDGGSDGGTDADAPPVADPTGFRDTAPLAHPRTNHTATLLHDGRVLVVGGESVVTRNMLDTVELFDPESETWTDGPTLPEPRSNHQAVRLDDGRVLVVGGGRSAPIGVPSGEGVLSSALIFDPGAERWTPTAGLIEGRSHFASALLPSGRVLVAGGGAGTHEHGSTCNGAGVDDCGPVGDSLGSAELYDPETGVFTATGAMAEPRDLLTLTALGDGRVLAAAGANDYAVSFASTEVYDERTGEWTAGPDLAAEDRLFHSAALLPSGQVLVGGGKKSNVAMLATVVLVDVDAGTSEPTAHLAVAHTGGGFVGLPSGRVLSVGGFRCPSPCTSMTEAEIYAEGTGSWTAIAPLASPRSGHTATLLDDGRVLVVAGFGPFGNVAACEITE